MKIGNYKAFISESRTPYMKECGSFNVDGRRVYSSPDLAYDIFANVIGLKDTADEYCYVACFDNRMHITGVFEASHGSGNMSIFPIREIMQKALLLGAFAIIIAHNHPSGDTEPSNDDEHATRKIKEAGDTVGISVADHLIIARDDYYSFKENGRC